jgi:cell division protein FtsQ
MNKILQIALWILSIGLIIATLGFVNKSQQKLILKKPVINIDYETENRFVDEGDILAQVVNEEDANNLQLSRFNVKELEEKLANNNSIKEVEVFKTVDGKLVVDVKQRRPIVRVFSRNESYYIDEKGVLMPLSNKYTSRLLVVSGFLNEPFGKRYRFNYKELNDTLQNKTLLDDIFKMADYILVG